MMLLIREGLTLWLFGKDDAFTLLKSFLLSLRINLVRSSSAYESMMVENMSLESFETFVIVKALGKSSQPHTRQPKMIFREIEWNKRKVISMLSNIGLFEGFWAKLVQIANLSS